MPHSLRAKLSGLHYKGILEDKDYKRLCKALDNESVFEQIRSEIEQAKTIEIKTDDTAFKASADVVINPQYRNFTSGVDIALQIIDKYRGDANDNN